jgi:hypothetical protein
MSAEEREQESLKLKNEGNEAFKTQDFSEATKKYKASLDLAEYNNEETEQLFQIKLSC